MLKKIARLIRKINYTTNVIGDVDRLIDFKIRSNHLLTLSLTSRESLTKENEDEDVGVIVSLTTYDKRIHD